MCDIHIVKLNKQYIACDRHTDMKNNFIGYVGQTDRHVFKLNKQYIACERRIDMKKKMRRVVLSKYNSVRDPKNI